ncbi:MAG: DUF4340 domain-containing protein [Planctomycetota bacterium]
MSAPPPPTATSLDQSGLSMKTTLVLALIVGGLGLWVFLGENEVKTSQETQFDTKRLLPHLEPEDVTALEITRRGQQDLALELQGEGDAAQWTLTAPLEDRAEEAAVQRLLNNLRFAEFAQRLSPPELDEVGMGETELTLTIQRRTKDPYALTFGAERPDGSYPVTLAGQDGGFLVRKSLIDTNFTDPLWTYRRKELFQIPKSVELRVERREGADLTLVRHDGFWRLDDPQGEYADPDRCNELVKEIRGLKALSSEQDAPSDADLARFGLAPPEVVVSLVPPEGAGETEAVELGVEVPQQSGVRYARVRGRPYVYRVASAKLDEQLEGQRDDYRSLKLIPLAGNAQTVTGIGVLFPGDGLEWHVERQRDGSWAFREVGTKVEDLVRQTLVERLVGLELLAPAEVTAAVAGVDAPQTQVRVSENELTRELQIGAEVEGDPGVYYVRRAGEQRIYTAELGESLLQTLRDADLALIDRTILIASHWDAQRLELRQGETPELVIESLGNDPPTWRQAVPEGKADKDMLATFMERFDQVQVEAYVARDLPELYERYGLDAPRTLTITVRTYVEGEETEELRTLYLGKREGEYVYARNPDGPSAIGKVDAGFLDRAARGFARGAKVLSVDANLVCELSLELGGQPVLELQKPEGAIAWQDGPTLLEEALEDRLKTALLQFESLELTEVSDATPEKLAERALAPPEGKLVLATRPFGGGEVTRYTVLLGQKVGERVRWAAVEGEGRLGQLFDEPIRALSRLAQDLPGAFPPVPPPK